MKCMHNTKEIINLNICRVLSNYNSSIRRIHSAISPRIVFACGRSSNGFNIFSVSRSTTFLVPPSRPYLFLFRHIGHTFPDPLYLKSYLKYLDITNTILLKNNYSSSFILKGDYSNVDNNTKEEIICELNKDNINKITKLDYLHVIKQLENDSLFLTFFKSTNTEDLEMFKTFLSQGLKSLNIPAKGKLLSSCTKELGLFIIKLISLHKYPGLFNPKNYSRNYLKYCDIDTNSKDYIHIIFLLHLKDVKYKEFETDHFRLFMNKIVRFGEKIILNIKFLKINSNLVFNINGQYLVSYFPSLIKKKEPTEIRNGFNYNTKINKNLKFLDPLSCTIDHEVLEFLLANFNDPDFILLFYNNDSDIQNLLQHKKENKLLTFLFDNNNFSPFDNTILITAKTFIKKFEELDEKEEKASGCTLDKDGLYKSCFNIIKEEYKKKKIWDKILHRKLYLKEFFNLTCFYKHFKTFYVKRFIAYTGRIFYYGFSLSIVHKLTRYVLSSYQKDDNIISNISIENYINSLDISIEDITTIREYSKENYYRIFNIIKDHNKTLYRLKLFINYNQNKNVNVELDSTSSGLQLLSLLLKDKDLSLFSNIYAKEQNYPRDIYTDVITDLRNQMEQLQQSCKPEKRYQWILNNNMNFGDSCFIFTHTWNKIKLKVNKKLFKKSLMAYPYGITHYTMLRNIKEYLRELGLHPFDIKLSANIFVNFLKDYIKRNFEVITDYLKLFKYLTKKFTFNTKYLSWTLNPFVKKGYMIRGFKHNFKFYTITTNLDKKKLISSLSSVFIHSLDAQVVHELIIRCTKNNIPLMTIHDAFIFPITNIDIIRRYIKTALINIYKADYLLKLLDSIGIPEDKKNIYINSLKKDLHKNMVCNNKNFIR